MAGMSAVLLGVVVFAVPAGAALDSACPPTTPDANYPDVEQGSTHADAIDCITWWEITHGTGFGTYEPDGLVRRDQMASFIARLVERLEGRLPRYSSNPYDDVRYDNPHEDNISRLAEVGLVQGTSETTYNPSGLVNRAQMATFLVRAYEYSQNRALPPGNDAFDDDDGNTHEANINKAANAGFAAGTGPRTFQPRQSVTRGQMATFIARVLDRVTADGGAFLPVESIDLTGTGEDLSDPFRLRSGTYTYTYDFGGDCYYGAFLDPEDDDEPGKSLASGSGPISGEMTITDVEPLTYRHDMITGTSACDWAVTLVKSGR